VVFASVRQFSLGAVAIAATYVVGLLIGTTVT
jgi:VIT1/CCC1 family predicted Fe2+/Mn2+ transporter